MPDHRKQHPLVRLIAAAPDPIGRALWRFNPRRSVRVKQDGQTFIHHAGYIHLKNQDRRHV